MRRLRAVLAVGVAAGVIGTAGLARAADHLDAPLVQADGRTDINDVYVFDSPSDPDNVVLAMTVNPGAGVISGTDFHPDHAYRLRIDTTGDAVADQELRASFDPRGAKQRVTIDGSGVQGSGPVGARVPLFDANGKRSGFGYAGVLDDPFFFDLGAFRNGLQFCPNGTGNDFFSGLNVTAIVIELPKASLPSSSIGVWGETTDASTGAPIDRMGRPAINTVFIPSAQKNAFNASAPADDPANFTDEVVATLLALGNDQATADALAAFLLPDVLTVDLSQPTAFPNGRALGDDVIDTELGLITGGAVTTDCVASDSAFRGSFPYLARAN
ncbi:MAG TPA: DUF4331 family protein [Acidimicrobiia bacterium]|nr:DUF4331 family protein [Acidimicrobiia bacterium]